MSNKWKQSDIDKLQAKGLKVGFIGAGEPENTVKSKYGNKKQNGFDSLHEEKCWQQLKLREQAGEITAIQLQVPFLLQSCKYVADFVYYDITAAKWIVADAKGMKTAMYRLKKRMMKDMLQIDILEM